MTKKQNLPLHPTHQAQVKKLNRVIGQLEGIKRMIEERRYCTDIITQTRAASSALKNIELSILETHLGHCVSEAFNSKNQAKSQIKINELIEVMKRF